MAKRDDILKLLVDRVRLKHMSLRTEECYRHWVARYCDFLRGVEPSLPSEVVRWRLHEASIQRAVKQAGVDAALDTWVTPHHLRHAYATHSTEDVQVIHKILGHVSVETTMGYRHREIAGASNPLDQMVEVAK